MLHEHLPKEADTNLSGGLLDQHEHPAEEAGAANDIDESDSDERVVDVNKPEWQIQDRHEAELLIEKLNQSGLGEDISVQEFLAYYDQLASGRPWIVLKPSLEEKVIDQQCIDHALCRFRYYKYKWDRISSRGAYQAIKIAATSFPNITPTLAYNGYYGCRESMGYQHTWLKEYDDLYFEIWRLVKKGTSFRAALEVVCELSRFPLRQRLMQTALGHDFTMTRLEKDFRTCTAAIRPAVEEDGAKELIADAVKKRVNKPKFYDDYIRRKTEIAHIVGILPSEKTETDATV
ncbi:hypothetical protein ZWY2020_007229 [Hordeum vulgare]|nr:hypothetical protein ZWY2020_007229 [Hordeum vulgare]